MGLHFDPEELIPVRVTRRTLEELVERALVRDGDGHFPKPIDPDRRDSSFPRYDSRFPRYESLHRSQTSTHNAFEVFEVMAALAFLAFVGFTLFCVLKEGNQQFLFPGFPTWPSDNMFVRSAYWLGVIGIFGGLCISTICHSLI